MKSLPDVCKDCAEYGSDFCDDCIREVTKDMPETERVVFNKAIRNMAKKHYEELGSKDSTAKKE